jgi:hypothetical protein
MFNPNSKPNSLTNSIAIPSRGMSIKSKMINETKNNGSTRFISNTPRFDPNKTQLHKDELHFFYKDVKNLKAIAPPPPAWWHTESGENDSADFNKKK